MQPEQKDKDAWHTEDSSKSGTGDPVCFPFFPFSSLLGVLILITRGNIFQTLFLLLYLQNFLSYTEISFIRGVFSKIATTSVQSKIISLHNNKQFLVKLQKKKKKVMDFLDGPMVKTSSNAEGVGLPPDGGTKIPPALWPKNKTWNRSSIVTNSIKSLKIKINLKNCKKHSNSKMRVVTQRKNEMVL